MMSSLSLFWLVKSFETFWSARKKNKDNFSFYNFNAENAQNDKLTFISFALYWKETFSSFAFLVIK